MRSINFGKGVITYNNFNIDISKPLENQIWELKEDLLQVSYSGRNSSTYILDIGWYPEFNVNGNFKILLIRNYDWDIPEILRRCRVQDFYNVLAGFIDYANEL